MQNSFGPRNAAMFCISTKTAPCAKPSQKFTAAVPSALSGLVVQSSTKSPVVRALKFASVAACPAHGASSTAAATAVHPFTVMTTFPPAVKSQLSISRVMASIIQNEPNAEPSEITTTSAMIGPTIAAITMSK